MNTLASGTAGRKPPRAPVAPPPAPSREALSLQARLGRRGLRLADIRTVADRTGLLNGLARGLVRLTLDAEGCAVAVRTAP